MKPINQCLLITLAIIVTTTIIVLVGYEDKPKEPKFEIDKITQKVTINDTTSDEISNRLMFLSIELCDPNLIFRTDTTAKRQIKEINEDIKRLRKPYKLMTYYGKYALIDYGTFKEIDSIKTWRYIDMLDESERLDSIDLAKKIGKERQEIELRILNQTCY